MIFNYYWLDYFRISAGNLCVHLNANLYQDFPYDRCLATIKQCQITEPSSYCGYHGLSFLLGGLLQYLVGVSIAILAGAVFNPLQFVIGLLLVFTIQLMVHFSNEYFDREVDRSPAGNRTWFTGGSGVLSKNELEPAVAIQAASDLGSCQPGHPCDHLFPHSLAGIHGCSGTTCLVVLFRAAGEIGGQRCRLVDSFGDLMLFRTSHRNGYARPFVEFPADTFLVSVFQ